MSNIDLFDMTSISYLHRCLLSYYNRDEKESLGSKSLSLKTRCARADRGGKRDQGLTYVVLAKEGAVGADAKVTGQQPRHLIGAISKAVHHHCQVTLSHRGTSRW
jgi:hypothetical protein